MKIINKITSLLLSTVIAGGMLCSCAADENEYTKDYQCYFVFDTSVHNTSLINNCVNPLSSGVFCMVSQTPKNGVRYINVQLNDGKTNESVAITTEIETRQSCILGASNGLVIGCSTLNDAKLYAYDRQCPNCLQNYLYKPLQWTNNGQWLTCTTCNRCYDLNNSGYVVSGDAGVKLLRYPATYTGTTLVVRN